MIIVRVLGGLGNQLFQYALGRRLTYDTDTTLLLDTEWYDRSTYRMNHFSDIEFKLDAFDTSFSIANDCDVRSVVPGGRRGTNVARRLCRYCPRVLQRTANYYLEIQNGYLSNHVPPTCDRHVPHGHTFEPSILDIEGPVYLDGFWQTEEYFRAIERVIRNELSVSTSELVQQNEIQHQIASTNSVGIHVRRGDYVKIGEALPLAYYKSAVSAISSKVTDPHFYLFSDDIDWVKNNLSPPHSTTYVTGQYSDKDYTDLELLRQCDHKIISNSTFGWWGAWLGEPRSGTVIVPSIWIHNQPVRNLDIVPDRWDIIDIST